jgi:hypothetical protein
MTRQDTAAAGPAASSADRPTPFTVWGLPAGLDDDWAMDFGGPIQSLEEAGLLADSLVADWRLYGRRLRRAKVRDRHGQVVYQRTPRRGGEGETVVTVQAAGGGQVAACLFCDQSVTNAECCLALARAGVAAHIACCGCPAWAGWARPGLPALDLDLDVDPATARA